MAPARRRPAGRGLRGPTGAARLQRGSGGSLAGKPRLGRPCHDRRGSDRHLPTGSTNPFICWRAACGSAAWCRWPRWFSGQCDPLAGRGSRVMRAALLQFSRMGYFAVALVALTGIVNTAILVGSVRGLTGTAYGRLLLVKIALFLLLVGLAAVNRFVLVPRIARRRKPMTGTTALIWTIGIEQALGLAIIAVVSILGTWPPAIYVTHIETSGLTRSESCICPARLRCSRQRSRHARQCGLWHCLFWRGYPPQYRQGSSRFFTSPGQRLRDRELQTSTACWAIVRSDENQPIRAIFRAAAQPRRAAVSTNTRPPPAPHQTKRNRPQLWMGSRSGGSGPQCGKPVALHREIISAARC